MFAEISVTHQQVSVQVQVPELTIDDIEVLITEEVSDPVDVFLLLQLIKRL